MDLSNVTELLGSFYQEAPLKQFLDALGLSEKPRLPRDSTTTVLHRYDLGIEITFTGERYLDQPIRDYPEGALVLTNLRFYGPGFRNFSSFDGTLPYRLEFGATLKQLASVFGEPAWFDAELAKARWDLPNHAAFAGFDEEGRSDLYGFQTPIVDD